MESKENKPSSEHDSQTIDNQRVELLKHISIRNKLSVAGYIREEVFANCKLYIVPSIIDFIVLYLFTVVERFDPQNIGRHHTLNGNTITHTGHNWDNSSSFCEKIVDKGKHHWQFKIIKNGSIVIGMWKCKDGNPPKSDYFWYNNKGYGYCTGNGYTGHGSSLREYGIKCKADDIVDMFVNFDDLTLRYSVNNKDYGVAWEIENTQYKCAVYTYSKNDSIKLIEYD